MILIIKKTIKGDVRIMKSVWFKNDLIIIDKVWHNNHLILSYKDMKITYIDYNEKEALENFKNKIKKEMLK